MKRAKIMLVAIAVIATVGGVLAFKAQKFAHKKVWCATKVNNVLTCTFTTDYKTTNIGDPFAISTTAPCNAPHALLNDPLIPTTSFYTTTVLCPITSGTVYTTNVD